MTNQRIAQIGHFIAIDIERSILEQEYVLLDHFLVQNALHGKPILGNELLLQSRSHNTDDHQPESDMSQRRGGLPKITFQEGDQVGRVGDNGVPGRPD